MPLYFLESKSKVRDLSAVVGAIRCSENGIGIPFLLRLFLLFRKRAHRLCHAFFPSNFNPSCGIFRIYGAFCGAPSTASEVQFFIDIFCIWSIFLVPLFCLRISIQGAGSVKNIEFSFKLQVRHRKTSSWSDICSPKHETSVTFSFAREMCAILVLSVITYYCILFLDSFAIVN
jgi:hypothetical protein